ncbi:MAG: TRAP transporter small permease subunit [Rhodopseudomonas sp.]|nr:TRAP transporter small permease subunit [Rhodopseudomonas sp.]
MALGLMAAIGLDFVNVVGRYTGGFTVLGADELEIYALIWIAFLGAAGVSWRRQHLRMDVLYHGSPPMARRFIAGVEAVAMFVVTGFVAVQSFSYVAKLYALGVRSDIVGVPMWLPHLAVGLCFAAMAVIVALRELRLVVRAWGDARSGAS